MASDRCSDKSDSGLGPWVEAARPKTLPAAIVPVLVGSALAWRAGAFQWEPASLCLAFALLVQIGTNFANDYGDFINGADGADRIGPRRAVAAGLIAPRTMARAGALTFASAFVVGLGLVWWGGWILLPVGVASLLFGWSYTSGPFPLAYHGLGDIFVFLFFGLVAVCGTYYVMTGGLDRDAVMAAVPVGLLATNILVVNNFRDAASDSRAGKRTLVVRYGRAVAIKQYGAAFAVAFLVPAVLAVRWENAWVALPSLVAVPAVSLVRKLRSNPPGQELNRLLAHTAQLLLLFGAAWAAAIALA